MDGTGGWGLPVAVEVCGQRFAIRSDFRAVLDALAALQDEGLAPHERVAAALRIFYPDWRALPDAAAAFGAAMVFVNLGRPVEEGPPRRVLVDWGRDAPLIAPAIDKVLGYSCRQAPYLHWWEFIGAYFCIGRGLFSEVVALRDKRARGARLDAAERAFCAEHPDWVTPPGAAPSAEEEAFFAQLGV